MQDSPNQRLQIYQHTCQTTISGLQGFNEAERRGAFTLFEAANTVPIIHLFTDQPRQFHPEFAEFNVIFNADPVFVQVNTRGWSISC